MNNLQFPFPHMHPMQRAKTQTQKKITIRGTKPPPESKVIGLLADRVQVRDIDVVVKSKNTRAREP
jgi:hypothetical protein